MEVWSIILKPIIKKRFYGKVKNESLKNIVDVSYEIEYY